MSTPTGCVPSPRPTGRILIPPPKARGNGPRLCAEHQPQRHGEARRFRTTQRLWASALAAAGPSDTAAVRWWFQDAPKEILYSGLIPFRFASNGLVGLRCLQKQLEHTA